MKQGKYSRKKNRRLLGRSQIVLVTSLVLILTCLIGGTIAYLVDDTDGITNTFRMGNVDVEITENFSNNVKNNVRVENTGDVKVDVKAMIVVTWQNTAGEIYPDAPVEGTDYTIVWVKDGWTGSGNGWYTYEDLAVDASTGILFTDCKPVDANTPKDYFLVVDVITEAIQADGGASW